MLDLSRRELLLAGIGAVALPMVGLNPLVAAPELNRVLSLHFDHLVGTSLDVELSGEGLLDPLQVESVILNEIDRLCRIFNLYDPLSELSRLNRSRGPVVVSSELRQVVRLYESWQALTNGACSSRMGMLETIWREAENSDRLPDAAHLASVVRRMQSSSTQLHERAGTVGGSNELPLNLNSAAKGLILQSIGEALLNRFSGIQSLCVNLGGDLFLRSNEPNRIGVQNPFHPAENREPLTRLRLTNHSVATSGGYQRFFTIGGERYSHLIDPRTGYPATGIASATVIAESSLVANLLATTLCILSPEEGLQLASRIQNAECLIVSHEGKEYRSPGFASFEEPQKEKTEDKKDAPKGKSEEKKDPKKDKSEEKKDPEKGEAWPEEFAVSIALELPRPKGKARAPYVAIWIEDAEGKSLRTVTVWGNAARWLPTMSGWWKIGKESKELVKAVTRATRGPGKYTVEWDGKDDAGKPLPQGTYTIKIEVHREHGKDVTQTGKLECGKESATLELDANAETEKTTITYGKREKPKVEPKGKKESEERIPAPRNISDPPNNEK